MFTSETFTVVVLFQALRSLGSAETGGEDRLEELAENVAHSHQRKEW